MKHIFPGPTDLYRNVTRHIPRLKEDVGPYEICQKFLSCLTLDMHNRHQSHDTPGGSLSSLRNPQSHILRTRPGMSETETQIITFKKRSQTLYGRHTNRNLLLSHL